ncbi:hypothetical protein PLICRDRAFT_30346 [Plicaturopsis crispa FD-325 SS-3]|nr:hypothetical protein PLICRDRAFT_30346 [Plicaturopsis crispa FD-325 SS-3]
MADAILQHLTATNIFDLSGMVAVVTGGGSGIGLMITSTLVANGARVYIIGPKQDDLDRQVICKVYNDVAEVTPGRGCMYGVQGDISRKSEAIRLAHTIGQREQYVTVLFNNAGICEGRAVSPRENTAASFKAAWFEPITQEQFIDTINTNAVGPYWMTFAFLPLLEKWKQSGPENPAAAKFVPQVVMTSSMNGWTKDPKTSGSSFPYMFSKSAIGQATSSLAHELLPLGIRVNGIAPGYFQTEMVAPGTADALGRSHVPADTDRLGLELPLVPTGGTDRDVGALALFLVTNHYVSGETVLIDGGTMLKHPSSW